MPERTRRTFIVEAHNRLSQPLYCIAFGLIALATVARGRRHRGSIALRLALGAVAALGLYLGGYGVAGAAQSQPLLLPTFFISFPGRRRAGGAGTGGLQPARHSGPAAGGGMSWS